MSKKYAGHKRILYACKLVLRNSFLLMLITKPLTSPHALLEKISVSYCILYIQQSKKFKTLLSTVIQFQP